MWILFNNLYYLYDRTKMENEGVDAQNLGEQPGEEMSVEERDREWNRFMRSSLESIHKYITKRINEMTRVRKRLYGHLPYGKSAIPEAGCVFLMPAVQYPLDNEQMPVIDIQTSFCSSSLFSGTFMVDVFPVGNQLCQCDRPLFLYFCACSYRTEAIT